MKKLIYGFLVATALLFSCTDFESYNSIPMEEGPAMAITLDATADSSFTVTFAPAAAASYYSFFIETSDEVKEYSASNILKCVYKDKGVAKTVNYKDDQSYTLKVAGMPNTTYQIYAVAASKEGMMGKVAQFSVTTTDGLRPSPLTFKAGASSVAVTFSEKLRRGEGKVYATVYAINALNEAPVEFEMPDSTIVIKGSDVTFTTPEVHAGANVCITWAEGAFTDLKGNLSGAFTNKGYDAATKKFKGISYRMATETIGLVSASDTVTYYTEWENLKMAFFSKATLAKVSDNCKIQLRYNEEGRSTLIDLKYRQHFGFADDTTLVVKLPEEPDFNVSVDVIIAEKSFQDKYGNETKGLTLDGKYIRFLESTGINGVYKASAADYWDEVYTWEIILEQDVNDASKVWVKNLCPFIAQNGYVAPDFNMFAGTLNAAGDQITIASGLETGYVNPSQGPLVLVGFPGSEPGNSNDDIVIDIQENGWLNLPNAWGSTTSEGFWELFNGGLTFIKISNDLPVSAGVTKASVKKVSKTPRKVKFQK